MGDCGNRLPFEIEIILSQCGAPSRISVSVLHVNDGERMWKAYKWMGTVRTTIHTVSGNWWQLFIINYWISSSTRALRWTSWPWVSSVKAVVWPGVAREISSCPPGPDQIAIVTRPLAGRSLKQWTSRIFMFYPLLRMNISSCRKLLFVSRDFNQSGVRFF